MPTRLHPFTPPTLRMYRNLVGTILFHSLLGLLWREAIALAWNPAFRHVKVSKAPWWGHEQKIVAKIKVRETHLPNSRDQELQQQIFCSHDNALASHFAQGVILHQFCLKFKDPRSTHHISKGLKSTICLVPMFNRSMQKQWSSKGQQRSLVTIVDKRMLRRICKSHRKIWISPFHSNSINTPQHKSPLLEFSHADCKVIRKRSVSSARLTPYTLSQTATVFEPMQREPLVYLGNTRKWRKAVHGPHFFTLKTAILHFWDSFS